MLRLEPFDLATFDASAAAHEREEQRRQALQDEGFRQAYQETLPNVWLNDVAWAKLRRDMQNMNIRTRLQQRTDMEA